MHVDLYTSVMPTETLTTLELIYMPPGYLQSMGTHITTVSMFAH